MKHVFTSYNMFLIRCIRCITMLLLCVLGSAYAQEQKLLLEHSKSSYWLELAEHSANFINDHAFNATQGFYYSELDHQGQVVSDKVYLLALSRMIYAQSYLASQGLADIKRAAASVDFILNNMLAKDKHGSYLIPLYKPDSKNARPTKLAINEQAYGLCGLVEYYRVTGDKKVLAHIHQLHSSFIRRFRDPKYGGYFDAYDLIKSEAVTIKSYASTVYVATAYLINLMEADTSRQAEYQATLRDLVSLAAEHLPDRNTGWIKENFARNWKADWRDWQRQGEHSVGIVGRNLQYAWLLLRAAQWKFISPKVATQYRQMAYQSIDNMLSKPSWDSENGGFLDAFVRENDSPMWNTNKAWWQQAEALMALAAALHFGEADLGDKRRERYADALSKTAIFFHRHFVDRENGGEFFNVTRNGTAIENELKGQKGKSAYHTVELAKFMIDYISR